jgi:hypothetical protein
LFVLCGNRENGVYFGHLPRDHRHAGRERRKTEVANGERVRAWRHIRDGKFTLLVCRDGDVAGVKSYLRARQDLMIGVRGCARDYACSPLRARGRGPE